jgi:hypothetical protein
MTTKIATYIRPNLDNSLLDKGVEPSNSVNYLLSKEQQASHFIDRTAVFSDGCLRRSDLHGLEFPLSQRYFSPYGEFDLTDLIQFRQA